ncbi:MAG: hypothetical protein WCB50_04840, partial [Pseudolabrys sp.]
LVHSPVFLLLDVRWRSGTMGRRRGRAPLIARTNRAGLAVVHMAIDGHAFHSGKCRLQASESTEAREAEDAKENFAHFSFPICFSDGRLLH